MEKSGIPEKLTKPAKWIGLGCFAVILLAVLLFMFLNVIHVDDGNNQNAGPDFTGWMISFYYFGRQLIYNRYFFGFNAALALGSVFAVLAIVVSLCMLRKSGKLRTAVLFLIVAVFALWAGIAYLNAFGLAESTASQEMWQRFDSVAKRNVDLRDHRGVVRALPYLVARACGGGRTAHSDAHKK